MTEVYVKGARELYEALSNKIPRRMEAGILQKALAAGAAIILKAARQNVMRGGDSFPNVRTGTLRRSLFSKRSKFGNTTTMENRIVSVRKGKRAARKGRDAWYARLVEYGHKARDGSMVKARPFMRTAFDQNQQKALDAIMAKMRQLIDSAVQSARF